MSRRHQLSRLHGHIADLVAADRTGMAELLAVCERPVREAITWTDYHRTWVKGDRSVTVQLTGLTKLVTNWTMTEGSMVIDTSMEELQEVRKVYVISEVVYADKLVVEVDTGEQKLEQQLGPGVPVAFSYFKFPVGRGGALQAGQDRPGNREVDFLLVVEEGHTK